MRTALPELGTIVPGHGPVGEGLAALHWLTGYLTRLDGDVARTRPGAAWPKP